MEICSRHRALHHCCDDDDDDDDDDVQSTSLRPFQVSLPIIFYSYIDAVEFDGMVYSRPITNRNKEST